MLAEETFKAILARLLDVKARGIFTQDRVLFENIMAAEEERRDAEWKNLVGYPESTPDYDGPVSDQQEIQQQEPTTSTTPSGEDPTTAPTTTDTTTEQTPTATPVVQSGSGDFEANAVILALETSTTASARAHLIVHQTPNATPLEQDGSSRLEVNDTAPLDQNVTTAPTGKNATMRQTPLPTPPLQGRDNTLEVDVVGLASEHLNTAPGRAHRTAQQADNDTIFGQDEGRSEPEIDAAFPTAEEGGTRYDQADAAEDDGVEKEEDEIVADGADPGDDGSGEYVDSPDDQADSDDHRDNEEAVGGVEVVKQIAKGTEKVLRLPGARHARSRPLTSADGHPTPPDRASARSTHMVDLNPRTAPISAPPTLSQPLRPQPPQIPVAQATRPQSNLRPIPGSLATASANSVIAAVRDKPKAGPSYETDFISNLPQGKTRSQQAAITTPIKQAKPSKQETLKQQSAKKEKGRKKYEETPGGTARTPQERCSTQEDARITVSESHRRNRGQAPNSSGIAAVEQDGTVHTQAEAISISEEEDEIIGLTRITSRSRLARAQLTTGVALPEDHEELGFPDSGGVQAEVAAAEGGSSEPQVNPTHPPAREGGTSHDQSGVAGDDGAQDRIVSLPEVTTLSRRDCIGQRLAHCTRTHSKRSRGNRTAQSGIGGQDVEDDGSGKYLNTQDGQAGAKKSDEEEEEEDDDLIKKISKASRPRRGTRLPGALGKAVPVAHQHDEEEEQKKKKSTVRSTWLKTFKERDPIDAKAKTRSQQTAIKQEKGRNETAETPQSRDGNGQAQKKSHGNTATDRHRRKVRKESRFGTGNVTLRSSPEAEDARRRARASNARSQLLVSGPSHFSPSGSTANNDTSYHEDNANYPSSSLSIIQSALVPSPPNLRRVESPRPINSSRQTGGELQPAEVYTTTDPDHEDDHDSDERSTASIPFERPTTSDTERRSAARRRLATIAPGNTTTAHLPSTVAEQDAIDYEMVEAAWAIIDATNRRRAMRGLSPIQRGPRKQM